MRDVRQHVVRARYQNTTTRGCFGPRLTKDQWFLAQAEVCCSVASCYGCSCLKFINMELSIHLISHCTVPKLCQETQGEGREHTLLHPIRLLYTVHAIYRQSQTSNTERTRLKRVVRQKNWLVSNLRDLLLFYHYYLSGVHYYHSKAIFTYLEDPSE